jgi:hypothetical protein
VNLPLHFSLALIESPLKTAVTDSRYSTALGTKDALSDLF